VDSEEKSWGLLLSSQEEDCAGKSVVVGLGKGRNTKNIAFATHPISQE
jgi:hypothetical protein